MNARERAKEIFAHLAQRDAAWAADQNKAEPRLCDRCGEDLPEDEDES